ncbi:MAG: 2-ketoisovalerate ferredoxin oxidoreductase [Spirochaetae bacterium HGW-Spirochaetae-1]|jgi:pyruvate ferredoxin oxidoreductase beta subunit|nr:MAG: 2-ketoisovalerate ferredoxin oxidoreductase [Spirochaetae bacterium HGW-Spirochaetae-1]
MNKKTTPLTLIEKEYALPGNRACVGCGLAIAYRHGLKALGDDVILTVPASCLTVLQGMYPVSSMLVPCLNTAFETTAASATGIKAALRALGRNTTTVVGWAGDGGTADIGIQALSGAAERNEDFIYVCYDNEAYMNTGTQKSGSTPMGARTTTTIGGKLQHKKDMARIMAAHDIPYVATVSPSYPMDLHDKFRKAKEISGTRYIHILIPCPPGWGYDPQYTVQIGRMAIECGMFDLYEVENGVFSFYGPSKKIAEKGGRKPVEEYIRAQSRFQGIDRATIDELQKWVDAKWETYRQLGYCNL